MNKTKFEIFLDQIRPLINAKALERLAKVPANTLGKHYRWVDQKPNGQRCAVAHYAAILKTLAEIFGAVVIDGSRIQVEGFSFYVTNDLPQVKKVRGEESLYWQMQMKDVCDAFDITNTYMQEPWIKPESE